MSTRSLIGRETPNGIEAIYCHWDGYPEHHGPILAGHYATERAVKALLALGDLDALGTKLGRKHDARKRPLDPKAKNWCVAYGRDAGGENTAATVHASEDAFLAGAREARTEYVYLFRSGRWCYRHVRKGDVWLDANV